MADLEAILDWLEQVSADTSIEFESELLGALEPLRGFPEMGRVPRDYDWRGAGLENLREVLVWEYRVGTVAESGHVEIVYLVHGRRRFPPLS